MFEVQQFAPQQYQQQQQQQQYQQQFGTPPPSATPPNPPSAQIQVTRRKTLNTLLCNSSEFKANGSLYLLDELFVLLKNQELDVASFIS